MWCIGAKLLIDLLQQNNVHLAVVHHLIQAVPAIVQNHSLPEIKPSSVHLPAESKEFGNIVQLIAVKVELFFGNLEGIQRCVVWIHRDAMEEATGLDPLQIEAIRVVTDSFVRTIENL